MKKICTLLLTAGMLLGVASGASAIDFKAKGEWIFGFGLVDTNFQDNGDAGQQDLFKAQQRVRLQVDAVASEALSATVFFEIGDQAWGNQEAGAALGTDGVQVKVRYAYLDWYVPNTDLSFRMGLQGVANPSVAGGAAILDDDMAGIVANYKINDMASVTFAWLRLYNDNYAYTENEPYFRWDNAHDRSNYLDNLDAFMLSVPIQGENWSVNPWIMLGFVGNNVAESFHTWNADNNEFDFNDLGGQGSIVSGIYPLFGSPASASLAGAGSIADGLNWNGSDDAYSTIWFAGLPMSFQHEAWNFELDINYGYVQYSGTYDVANIRRGGTERVNNSRSGWLIKGLAEYQMDWGTPGIFAWYGSGDDDDVKNGSEMMPYLSPAGNFTSFLGDGELAWQPDGGQGLMLNYSGTWGIGLQIKDLSFIEDLSHIIRIAYWGGTNSSSMANYIDSPYVGGGFYLTTSDYLVEVNFDTTYQIYENLAAHIQLGYIFNGIDHDNYKDAAGLKRLDGDARDGYKATLSFQYSF